MPETEKTFKDISKKHRLPSFEELDNEFEISQIENEKFLLREIIGKMNERAEYFTLLIDQAIHPDTNSISGMHECRFFDDNQKRTLYEVYKTLMEHQRKSLIVMLKRKQEDEAEFISSFYADWKKIHPKLMEMASTLHNSWKKDILLKEVLEYFG